ncbi:MAG: DUF4830 domain-containing protein [Clostridia bacterium]
MVFSVKANKGKIIAIAILLAIVISAALMLPKITTTTTEEFSAVTLDERIEFLNSFGWQITREAIESREVTIPKEFSEVYETYNEMQKAQGFDLEEYKGLICTQYIYMVENYPLEGSEVHATLLVYDGKVIGGDISCAESDGFMHGFSVDSKAYGE